MHAATCPSAATTPPGQLSLLFSSHRQHTRCGWVPRAEPHASCMTAAVILASNKCFNIQHHCNKCTWQKHHSTRANPSKHFPLSQQWQRCNIHRTLPQRQERRYISRNPCSWGSARTLEVFRQNCMLYCWPRSAVFVQDKAFWCVQHLITLHVCTAARMLQAQHLRTGRRMGKGGPTVQEDLGAHDLHQSWHVPHTRG